MLHFEHDEIGTSHLEIEDLSVIPGQVAIWFRITLFLAVYFFLAASIYFWVYDQATVVNAEWKLFGTAVVVGLVIDVIAGDYYREVYNTAPGTLLYGFFMIGSAVMLFWLLVDIEILSFVAAIPTAVIGCFILLRGLDLFEVA